MQTVSIDLFGLKLLLSQRSVRDIIDASLFDSDKKTPEDKLFLNAFIIHSALKVNQKKYSNLKFYQLKRKREKKQIDELISPANILAQIGITEMNELCTKIYELDFGEPTDKKKVDGKQT